MYGRSNAARAADVSERDDQTLEIATGRFERRLAEECGKLRVDMAEGFGAVQAQITGQVGGLRAEMIERNSELLKWMLVFLVAHVTAIAALFALFR